MMMITIGREFHSGYPMPFWFNAAEKIEPEMGYGERFRLLLIESGTGVIRINDRRWAFVAPTVFCLNEEERPVLEQALNISTKGLYFHPSVVNSEFDFSNLCNPPVNQKSLTMTMDRHYIETFTKRNQLYYGQLEIGWETAQAIAALMNAINLELVNQSHFHWRCRSRSFLLELLFKLERLYSAQGIIDIVGLPSSAADVEQILVFLHANYQQRITIADLTRSFHTNRTTLADRFKDVTGMSIMTYLNKLRVRMACLMLRDSELPASEIAESVGFSDYNNFSRTFVKNTGTTPREFRQRSTELLQQAQ
jgi:AraC-like DNA-binding protein